MSEIAYQKTDRLSSGAFGKLPHQVPEARNLANTATNSVIDLLVESDQITWERAARDPATIILSVHDRNGWRPPVKQLDCSLAEWAVSAGLEVKGRCTRFDYDTGIRWFVMWFPRKRQPPPL